MRRHTLQPSGIEISALTLGLWAIGGDDVWGDQDETQAIDAIHCALDLGINSLDTAEGYGSGRSEELLGKALAGRRSDAVIATKVLAENQGPGDLEAACEASLRRLGTDYIDLYYLHWPTRDHPIEETVGRLERLREAGKIRVPCVSNFGPSDLGIATGVAPIPIDQLVYNLMTRAIEFEIAPACQKHDVAMACYSPLMQGLLSSSYTTDTFPEGRKRSRHFSADASRFARHGEPGHDEEVRQAESRVKAICADAGVDPATAAIAWLFRQPGVATVIAGARSPDQVRRNVAAADAIISDDLSRALTEATEPLKNAMGGNADLWQGGSNARIR